MLDLFWFAGDEDTHLPWLLTKTPNRRSSLFHFSHQTAQEQPQNLLCLQPAPSTAKTSPHKCQKLLTFPPQQLQVLSTPREVAPRVPGQRDPAVTVPKLQPVPGGLCSPSLVCQAASVVKSHQMIQDSSLQLGLIEYSLGTG